MLWFSVKLLVTICIGIDAIKLKLKLTSQDNYTVKNFTVK